MNILQLRQVVETVLGYYDYTRNQGVWTKSLSLQSPGSYVYDSKWVSAGIYLVGSQRVPAGWTPIGLETVIRPGRAPKFTDLSGSGLKREMKYTLDLCQYTKELDVEPHVLKLLRHFGQEASCVYHGRDETSLCDKASVMIRTTDFDLRTWDGSAGRQDVPSPVETLDIAALTEQ